MLLSFTANLGLNPTKSDLCTSKSFKGKINNILLTVMFIGIKIKHNKLFFLNFLGVNKKILQKKSAVTIYGYNNPG